MAGIEVLRTEADQELDWLYMQEYKTGENRVTEALFKWFYFSRPLAQRKFLSRICEIRGERARWTQLSLQDRGRKGTADATITLGGGSRLLFEVKIKPNAVSSTQLKRHLRDAGWRKKRKPRSRSPLVVLITPDFRPPKRLEKLSTEQQRAVRWIPWTEMLRFLTRKLRHGLHSNDRLLRDGLVAYLKQDEVLSRYLA